MAKVLVDESILSRMADGLRGPFMLSEKMTPSQMADFAARYAQFIMEKKYSGYSDPSAAAVPAFILRSSPELTTAIFTAATTVGSNAFENCVSLTNVQLDSAQSIFTSAFMSCSSLSEISLPEVVNIGSSAFKQCSSLISIYAPKCTTMSTAVFSGCTALREAIFPNLTTLSTWVFASCSSLSVVDLPKVSTFPPAVFQDCINLVSINTDNVTSLGMYPFNGAGITTLKMLRLSSIASYAFSGMRNLQTLSIPMLLSIPSAAFWNCTQLSSLILNARYIASNAFSNCTRLMSLRLNYPLVVSLAGYNAFSSTPIGGYSAVTGAYGSIYVPASLVASYKTALNWSRFSNRITSIVET